MLQYLLGQGGQFWAGAPLLLVGIALLIASRLPPEVFQRGERPERGGFLASVTFHELSAAVSFLAILGVYGLFTAELIGAPPLWPIAVGALIGSTVLLVAVMVASHILLAVFRRPEGEDERDRLVNLRSARNSGGVLAVGIWGVMFIAIAQASPTYIAYAAMGVFVLSELVRLASQVVYYRTSL